MSPTSTSPITHDAKTSAGALIDQRFHAALGRFTGGLSPSSLFLAQMDWASHLAWSPGKRMELVWLAMDQQQMLMNYLMSSLAGCTDYCVLPPKQDKRFTDSGWHDWPFNALSQSFLLAEQWWCCATRGVNGVDKHHQDVVSFMARQWLDIFSPGNFALTNPQVLRATRETGGQNFVKGWANWVNGWQRHLTGQPPEGAENFVVGKDVAITPGKVVMRNKLVELIQYSPATDKVYAEPILIVPAWIMKYYILDLSPHNSLIKYLTEQGHTVFCISWKNPGEAERDFGMEDYLQWGLMDALDAINAIVPKQKIHAAGYCLGGTLLSVGAAAMGRDGDNRLASMTLFAAQTDFSEPGELALFIDESQVSFLENIMSQQGYLKAGQMSGAFELLRSYDLIWSRIINEVLLGDSRPLNDLMAWNADATRMPAKMHSQYLRQLFLNDAIAEGHYLVKGKPISLNDIRIPIFCVGTERDHIAPWRSVYKLHLLTGAPLTFVLTTGGHNAGIISEPGRKNRQYQMTTRHEDDPYVSPDSFQEQAPVYEDSWWMAWMEWLQPHSGALVTPPSMGAAKQGYKVLCDAPGTYVLQK